jgi:hypothetical protein
VGHERRHVLERRRPITPPQELRWSEHVPTSRTSRVFLPQYDDAVRIAEGQPLEQHRVDDGEDRRVRAEAERQREHRNGGEAGRADAHPNRVANVLQQ